jgi:acyl carrier protein
MNRLAGAPDGVSRKRFFQWNGMQTYETILSLVIELVQPLAPQGREVREDTDLVSDLEFDSLKVMNLVEQVEDRFDVSVPLNILPDIRTVRDFAVQLQRIIGGN